MMTMISPHVLLAADLDGLLRNATIFASMTTTGGVACAVVMMMMMITTDRDQTDPGPRTIITTTTNLRPTNTATGMAIPEPEAMRMIETITTDVPDRDRRLDITQVIPGGHQYPEALLPLPLPPLYHYQQDPHRLVVSHGLRTKIKVQRRREDGVLEWQEVVVLVEEEEEEEEQQL